MLETAVLCTIVAGSTIFLMYVSRLLFASKCSDVECNLCPFCKIKLKRQVSQELKDIKPQHVNA